MIITEKQLKNIIECSIKNVLNEWYDGDDFYRIETRVFNGDKTLVYLEQLVYNLANEGIDTRTNDDGNIISVDWSDFVKGIVKLYNMSKEKVEYDKKNLKQIYQKLLNSGKEDEFWDNPEYYDYEYIDSYLGQYANTEFWDKYMPKPEQVKEMVDYFIKWLENEIEFEIRNYGEERWKEFNYFNKTLSSIY